MLVKSKGHFLQTYTSGENNPLKRLQLPDTKPWSTSGASHVSKSWEKLIEIPKNYEPIAERFRECNYMTCKLSLFVIACRNCTTFAI